jgi:uncharacterized protein DUF3631
MEGTPMPLTLADYAAAKGLPIDFLASLGVGEETTRNGPRLRIPYQDQDGGEVIVRFRHELKGKGFSWPEGSAGRLVLYGLNRLPSAREAGHVVIVEGESDAQTLWFNDLPAVGVPGASNWNEARDAQALEGFATVFVVDEGDQGASALLDRLKASSLANRVRVVTMPEARTLGRRLKDPSDLFLDDRAAFCERMTEALREARPLVAQSEERNPNGEREAIAKLGAGDLSAFVARAKADAGFPLEPDAIEALNQLVRRRAPDFERLRARLKAETKVRFAALEAVMKAEAANGDSGDSGGDGVAGRPVRFEEIEPWNEPVDGSRLLAEISKAIGAYVVMDAHQRDATALWTMFAHAHDLRDYAPLLAVTAPTKRCGKTRLQETLARLVPRPQLTSGITAALLPRLVEKHRPTLFIDEYDAQAAGDREMAESLRGQLNSSFNKSSAAVLKLVPLPGGGWDERQFSTWAPTCVAGIGMVPDTVKDRSVVIRLLRKPLDAKVGRLRGRDGGDLLALARKAARFVNDKEQAIRSADPASPEALNDRQADAWDPLFAIAEVAGGPWPERARRAAQALCGAENEEDAESDMKIALLADIRDIFARLGPKEAADQIDEGPGRPRDGPRLLTREIIDELVRLEERPWGHGGKHRSL